MTDEGERTIGWSDDELRACVAAYRELQLTELAGNKINKTIKRNEVLETALQLRSSGSYEFRMANISSVLSELGLPVLQGYAPRGNVGASITARLVEMINEIWEREGTLERPTADPEMLETRILSARQKIKSGSLSSPPVRTEAAVRAEATGRRFVRDPNIIAWVAVTAGGVCESCGLDAPFTRDDGQPYLEVHHVRPLAEGGPDSIDNAIAACPTCHRRFHHGADKNDLRKSVIRKIERLVDHPIRAA